MNELVWAATLDGVYDVVVTRTDHHHGVLTITFVPDQRVLHSEPVELSYGAVFGPDALDVDDWRVRAMAFVDTLRQSE